METNKLQLKLAKESYELSKGNIDVCISFNDTSSEEKIAFEKLFERGILKRNGKGYINIHCTSETKFFIDNEKTYWEIGKERNEKREEEKLDISKKALKISWLAFLASAISVIITIITIIKNN